jgi:hypothetical protein
MTDQTATTDKSLISGGNAEILKSEAPAADKSVGDILYSDDKPGDKAEAKTEDKAAEQTPEQKAEADKAISDKKAEDDKAAADKAEADRIAAMTPEEKKAHDDKIAADKKAEEEDKAKENKEPVDLSDIALPDGFKANPEVMAELTAFINEHGLDKAAAEKLTPVGVKIAESAVKQINDGYETTRAGWRDQVANDPILGSKEQMLIADKGLEAYGTPALRELLDKTGIGDNPEVIRAFHKIGKRVAEDVIERGGSGDTQRSNAADAMYPTMKK